MENRKKTSYFRIKKLFLGLFFLAILGLGIGFVPWYRQGIVAQDEDYETNGFFLYEETLVSLDPKKELFPCFRNGDRVGTGEKIAYQKELTLDGVTEVPLYAPSAGLVTYGVDGLETVLHLLGIDNLAVMKLLQHANTEGYPLESGLKIMDNHAPVYLVAAFSREEVSAIEIGNGVGLTLAGESAEGVVLKKFYDKEKTLFLFRLEPNAAWYCDRFVIVKTT